MTIAAELIAIAAFSVVPVLVVLAVFWVITGPDAERPATDGDDSDGGMTREPPGAPPWPSAGCIRSRPDDLARSA